MIQNNRSSREVESNGLDSVAFAWDSRDTMTATVERIADEVKGLPKQELDEFLSWLADYELAHPDEWDGEIQRDSQPGGRLEAVLARVRGDIAGGRTRPLDEVINNP